MTGAERGGEVPESAGAEDSDWRAAVARYYDLAPHHPQDLDFYLGLLDGPDTTVLELGCGTGRITAPLAERAGFVLGVDNSPAMLEVCRRRVAALETGSANVELLHADITDLAERPLAGGPFDRIIAPFRVLQNLATDREVDGLLAGIARHLAPGGTAVLNAFCPNRDRQAMRTEWPSDTERLAWEVQDGDAVVRCYDRRVRLQEHPLVLFPELVYRRVKG